ncbi:MAG: molybdenum cofactor guanylyltransferase MobA [Alphaproteobacteria bacterium]|jgi:molybdopterin-guanine dinucleotide biosynthesis protein A
MTDAPVPGLVLAGGLSRRMGGGDKCLRPFAGATILDRIVARLRPQVSSIAINANGDAARFARFGLPVLADTVEGFAGPLAGILAGMRWAAAAQPAATHMLSVASDAPFFPVDLAARLLSGASAAGTPLACAASAGQAHPVFGLWPVALADDLERAMREEGLRKVDAWTSRHGCAEVEFPFAGDVDPFFNVNRPDDLAAAEALLRDGGGERPA